MSDFEPVPQASGSLEPPNRRPPTAVGTSTPEPAPRPRREQGTMHVTHRRPPRAVRVAARIVGAALGTAAGLAKALARAGKKALP